MQAPDRRENMIKIMSQNEEFIIIGLTGRVGSGCTAAANIFGMDFQELELGSEKPGMNGFKNDMERDRRIIHRFAKVHWMPFDVISTRTLISTFLLDQINEFAKQVDNNVSCFNPNYSFNKEVLNQLHNYVVSDSEKYAYVDDRRQKSKNYVEIWLNEIYKKHTERLGDPVPNYNYKLKSADSLKKSVESLATDIQKSDYGANRLLELCGSLFESMASVYAKIPEASSSEIRQEYLTKAEDTLKLISLAFSRLLINSIYDSIQFGSCGNMKLKRIGDKKDFKLLWEVLQALNESVSSYQEHAHVGNNKEKCFLNFMFVHDLMPLVADTIRAQLKRNSNERLDFTQLYQKFGNEIRFTGKIDFKGPEGKGKESANPKSKIFALPKKMVQFIKALRHPFEVEKGTCRPVRIVIDSIKNVFEAYYLHQRYSAFYLVGISADDQIRKDRLMVPEGKNMTMADIQMIDWNEYPDVGHKVFREIKTAYHHEDVELKDYQLSVGKGQDLESARKKVLENHEEIRDKFFHHVLDSNNNLLFDPVRIDAYRDNSYQFYLQDVSSSLENADIFISNNHEGPTKNIELRWEIVRTVSLIMFPGLVVPTNIERCMQIAFSAKANSGCLSRQVGAVVTDKDFNILSIGWNDVPCGDISCSRKNLIDLCKFKDEPAYSKYELKNRDFRDRLKSVNHNAVDLPIQLQGLPLRYCFKDLHMAEKNPMRSRAMHAEEKALAKCGTEAEGGYLFTTSSPCEMCSKNAKNHKIAKIFYIELYPGISETQYTMSGDTNNRATHQLFTGAIGRAYMQLYSSILPQKDILDMLGINETIIYSNPKSLQERAR